ncbi:MAG: hypothetical protein RL154_1595 [Pseudomonadota bacterium]|jgi:CRP/FNR family transcriptional regulator
METLRKISIFECLEEKYLIELKKICKLKQYTKNQIIFFEGEEPKSLLIIIKGKVAVYKTKENGNETIINIFYEGELFAEAPCFNNFAYPASCKCLQDCEILTVDYKQFKDKFLQNPEICLKLISGLSQKIKKLSRFISDHNKTAAQKLAEYLMYHDINDIKQKDLAARLNIRPETLSRAITKFANDGIIQDNFVDKLKLAELL